MIFRLQKIRGFFGVEKLLGQKFLHQNVLKFVLNLKEFCRQLY